MGNGGYRALLIGNSTFPADANNLQTLEGPVNDISLLRSALTDPETGLFDPDNVRILPERTSAEILMELEQFFGDARRDDVLLLYYSGHGLLNERGRLFMCARDTRTDLLKSTSVSSMAVNMMFDESAAQTTVIVLDCCHSGAFKGGALPDSLKGTGRFVLTSCRSGQLANDADRRNRTSLFTQHLVEGLTGGVADSNGDGYVDLSEVFDFVSDQLRVEGRQIPQRDFAGDGDLAIARRVATKGATVGVGTGAAGPPAGPERHREPPRIRVVETELDFGTLTARGPSPRHRIRVGGEVTVVEADSWIAVVPVPEGVAVSVDTSSAGRLSGHVRLKAGDDDVRISLRAVIEEPEPITQPAPPVPPPSPRGGERRKRPPVWAMVAAAVLGLIVLGWIADAMTGGDQETGGNGGGGGGEEVTLSVAGNQLWTDTGIDLGQYQYVVIGSSGQIDTATDIPGRNSGPDGIAGEEYHGNNVMPGAPHGALLAKIGEDGFPQLAGSQTEGAADRAGRLYLGINDKGVENNSGSYDVRIAVS